MFSFIFGRPVLALTLSGYGLVIFLCKNPPALFIGGFLHKQSFIFPIRKDFAFSTLLLFVRFLLQAKL